MRPGALGVGKVVTPEQGVDPYPLACRDLMSGWSRCAQEDIGAEVLTRLSLGGLAKEAAELPGVVPPDPLLVHSLENVGQPPRPVLGQGEAKLGMTVEHPGPDHHPERASSPPPGLGGVDGNHAGPRKDVLGRSSRVDVHDQLQILGGGPDRLVDRVVVGRLVAPQGRDHHCSKPRGGDTLHLGDGARDIVEDRDRRHAATPFRAVRAQLGQPPVVGAGTGHHELTVELTRRLEPGAEGRRGPTAQHVCIGKDHLAGNTLLVQLREPGSRVVGGQLPAVAGLRLPLLAELRLFLRSGLEDERAKGERALLVLVEGLPVLRIDVVPVGLGGRAGVGVGRDHEIAIHGAPLCLRYLLGAGRAPCV